MSVQEIEAAIEQLAPPDLARLAAWFAEYQEEQWDKKNGRDLDAGRLDAFLAAAEAEYQSGQVRPLWPTGPSPTSGSTTTRSQRKSIGWRTTSSSG